MAYRYRKVNPRTGDIISPEDINQNNRVYVGEFMGMLDRDNFDENSIGVKEIKRNAFNKIYFDKEGLWGGSTNNYFVLLGNNTSWHTQDNADRYLSKVEFEADTDGTLICEWHGGWNFLEPITSSDASGPAANDPLVISFRMLVNGTEISRSFRNIDSPAKSCATMYGCYQIPAGPVKVIVQARIYRIKGSTLEVANQAGGKTPSDRCRVYERELIVNYRKR